MATRGTGFLLTENKVYETTEFNGDMYPEGYGDMFFKGIKNVNTVDEFKAFAEKFNEENFGYEEELVYEEENNRIYDVMGKKELIIDFNIDYFGIFFSDWVFFKNLTGLPVRFITCDEEKTEVVVNHGESIRFNFGYLEGTL